MAGHSKWANIRFRKAAKDKKRAKIFTKLIREITVAAKMGGGDPDANPRLRAAIDDALSNNMSRDTIERARKRGAGGLDGANLEQTRYEGYGPGGIAVMVDCLTDNKNRTVADVRYMFTKYGGNLGTDGSVAYLFTQRGIISFEPGANEDKIIGVALEAGAEDVLSYNDGSIDVITSPEQFVDVKKAIYDAKLKPINAEITMVAANEVTPDEENAEKLIALQEALEDLDDVQKVYTNADFPESFY